MDERRFWDLLEGTTRMGGGPGARRPGQLVQALDRLGARELAAFDALVSSHVAALWRWDVLGVAHLLRGGCDDDGLELFCAQVIARGERSYLLMLDDPQGAAMLFEGGGTVRGAEDLLLAPAESYEEITGEELVSTALPALVGDPWSALDLRERFPRLSAQLEGVRRTGAPGPALPA